MKFVQYFNVNKLASKQASAGNNKLAPGFEKVNMIIGKLFVGTLFEQEFDNGHQIAKFDVFLFFTDLQTINIDT